MLAQRPVQIFSRFCGRSANTHLPDVLAETPDELDVPSPGARADRAGNRLFDLGAFVPADSDDLKIGGCRHSSSVATQHILARDIRYRIETVPKCHNTSMSVAIDSTIAMRKSTDLPKADTFLTARLS